MEGNFNHIGLTFYSDNLNNCTIINIYYFSNETNPSFVATTVLEL